MGYKWIPVTEDFDKTLVIKKWRFDVSIPISGNFDGALSELPNIDIKTCWNNPQPSNGYAFSNRFNLGQKYFSSRYYGWTDKHWTATTEAHTTLVSGTTYEFECPVDLYWAGNYSTPWNTNIPNYMWFYVAASTFEITPTESAATYVSGTTTITVNTDNDTSITWTASTSDSWLSLSTLTGAGDGSVTVTYTKNNTFQSRTGTVTFTSSDGDVLTFTIEQEQKQALIYDRPIYRSGNLVKKMYRSGELIYYKLNYTQPTPPGPEETPLTFNIISAGTIYWRANRNSYTKDIQYSVNDGPWSYIISTINPGTPISLNTGDVVRFKGDGAISTGSSAYNTFRGSTAIFEASGNVASLIDSTNYATVTTIPGNSFQSLFRGVTGLTSAENLILPGTTVGNSTCREMFRGCTSLTTAPALPATTLADRCYAYMFMDCTSLTTAPALPATTLEDSCYFSMFADCTSLTTAPELPATTLDASCYGYMFNYCTNLNYIKCLATDISAEGCTSEWVENVASAGTFVTPSSTQWTTGTSGIPEGWTRVNA